MGSKHLPPEFRFYYFTKLYKETVAFYNDVLGLEEFRSWDRGEQDRGTIFKSPNGSSYIEIEEGPDIPIIQGGLYIEVKNVDQWFDKLQSQQVNIIQPLVNTTYGHRSFKFKDPNNLSIGFFEYL